MATHSSVLAWRIPVTGEPGGLPSMGSQSRTRLKRLSSSKLSVTKWGLDCSDLFQWISFRGLLHIKLNPVWWLCSVFNLFNLKTPIYTFNQNSISFEVKPTLYGHGFGQTPRDSGGHGSLACCSPWGHKQSDTPEWLNNNDKRGLYTACRHVWPLRLKRISPAPPQNQAGNANRQLSNILTVLSNKLQPPLWNILIFHPQVPPYALRTTAVLWRTHGISRLGEVLLITTICPVHHRISNRRPSLITRIAEGITQWHSCMKEHTDSYYFHAVPTAKNSFLHCYFREPCPVNIKTLHTHAHTYSHN